MLMERSNIKNSFLAPDQLEALNTLLNNFDKEIGIPTTPYQKAERLTAYESESQMIDATARAVTWKKTIDTSLDIINAHFGTDIKCEFRYIPDEDPDRMLQNEEGGDNNVDL